VFVVDSVDSEKITKARDFLHNISNVEELNGFPMAIALNKRDLPDCMTKEETMEKLELGKIQEQRPCEAFLTTINPTSDVDTENDKFLEWISNETMKSQTRSPKISKKLGSVSALIWQPIVKIKNRMFE
jgi:signal recognition particle receptor subunit beta